MDFADGSDDVGVRTAATEIAAHPLPNLVVGQSDSTGFSHHIRGHVTCFAILRFLHQRHGRTDLSWRAESALKSVVLDEGGLHGMKRFAFCQPLDRCYLLAVALGRQRQTR